MRSSPLPLPLYHRVPRSTTRLRQVVIVCVLCLAIYCFLLGPEVHPTETKEHVRVLPEALLNNRFLKENQCRTAFPGLLDGIDKEVAKGPFKLERNPYNLGPLIARIRDGQLYILSATRKSDLSKDMLAHRSATLHQIANALLTWPRPRRSPSSSPFSHIPNTIIAFNHHDDPLPSTFSYSRPLDPSYLCTTTGAPKRFFPIPHFSFYSWPNPLITSLPHAAREISLIESTTPFTTKLPKAIWRGTTWFNSPHAGRARQTLVHKFSDKPWADIAAFDANYTNALPIEDFCRYKYIVHTEGVTYSGRFQFHNLCASVVLAPPIMWAQHLSHLLKPVFSYDLGVEREGEGLTPYPASWVREAWPVSYDAEREANIVFVAPDWSDLEATVQWLEAHPGIAEGIARRQRAVFAGEGYLSPAAEMCYWRGLIKGWSEVVQVDEGEWDDLGEVAWEEFSLREVHK